MCQYSCALPVEYSADAVALPTTAVNLGEIIRTVSMRALLGRIDRLRATRLLEITVDTNGRLKLWQPPHTKCCGLYWLYTSYSLDQIASATRAPMHGAVDIAALVKNRRGLANIHRQPIGRFKLVYNGVGGIGVKGHGGLRERIHQEFNGGSGTGSLAILYTSLSDLTKWRYSYVSLGHSDCESQDFTEPYDAHGESLEVAWRLHYGWPLLCKR